MILGENFQGPGGVALLLQWQEKFSPFGNDGLILWLNDPDTVVIDGGYLKHRYAYLDIPDA
jgi:hypothetical protein